MILTERRNSPGSVLTRNEAMRMSKPVLEVDLAPFIEAYRSGALGTHGGPSILLAALPIVDWISEHEIAVLNVAGNREFHADCLITHMTEWFIDLALANLNLDGLLVQDSDIF